MNAIKKVRRAIALHRVMVALDGLTKETPDTPFEKCEAKDPLTCRYHGSTALFQMIKNAGFDPVIIDKPGKGFKHAGNFVVTFSNETAPVGVGWAIGPALNAQGFEVKETLGHALVIGKKKAPSDEIDEVDKNETGGGGDDAEMAKWDAFLEDTMSPEDEQKMADWEAFLSDNLEGEGTGEESEGAQNVTADPNLLPPLEHDESKFPQVITQDELDAAIKNGKSLGGASGDNARLITLPDGRRFVCKAGTGTHAAHIHNEVLADQAYRAGGIMAPDCQEYVFGNGNGKKTYKLSELIEGQSLKDFMETASNAQKEAIRDELLKGFPLDVLFSNWDVIGTSRDNVIVDKDGHAWRVDNGGSFNMAAMSNQKTMAWAVENYIKQPKKEGKPPLAAFENWDEEGGWAKRQWIDDYRTMRIDAKNRGLFDGYSTADIFLSAGNIDLGRAVKSLPGDLQKALAKPLFEMKQMAMRSVSADLAGYGNNEALSAALDATYEASKQGFRELCVGEISFASGGIGAKESDKGADPVYPKQKPEPPENPEVKFSAAQKMPNASYTGTQVADAILKAAKTINYHAGVVTKDANGNVIGSGNVVSPPNYTPNPSTIAQFQKIDRAKLEKLAETDDAAKQALAMYDTVANAVANGFKEPIQVVQGLDIKAALPVGFKTPEEKEFEEHKADAMAKYHKALAEYNSVTLPKYNQEKDAWIAAEKAKTASGKPVLQGNFYDIANDFMEAAYGTNGIARHDGEGIGFLEHGKYQNKYGGMVSGATTKNDSWTPAASRLKVLDLLMRGMSIGDVIAIKDDDNLINNGHWSGPYARKWFRQQAQELKKNPEQMRRELAAYAVFKGLQTVKLENQTAPMEANGKTVQWIDNSSHSVGLIRKESYDNAPTNSVAPIVQKGANTSCGFQDNGSINTYPYAYQVPLWNVAYTYSDANHKGSQYDAYKASEGEWVATLIGLTPVRVSYSKPASENLEKARENPTIKGEIENRRARLAPFFTTMADLDKIKASA